MAFEFSEQEKTSIANFVKGGWPEQMAEVAVAAKKAGYDKAEEHAATFVKLLAKGEGSGKADVEANRKRCVRRLGSLSGCATLPAYNGASVSKRQLSRLG